MMFTATSDGGSSMGAGKVEQYRFTWTTAGQSAADSMPLGNGDLAANVYVAGGNLYLLLSKSDAFDGDGNLLKLGRVKVSLSPNPFADGKSFEQSLDIAHGWIDIAAGGMTIRVWIDANRPVYHIEIRSPSAVHIVACPEFWPRADGQNDALSQAENGLIWHRRNATSRFLPNLKYYNIEPLAATHADPFLDLAMGCLMESPQLKVNAKELTGQCTAADIRIHAVTQKSADPVRFTSLLRSLAADNNTESNLAAHVRWWDAFWDRSWIIVSDNHLKAPAPATPLAAQAGYRADADGGFVVAQHYAMQRFMMACQSRGGCQTPFNGGLFTTPIHLEEDHGPNQPRRIFDYKEDERMWGRRFTFQNQRLLYWPMISAGDTDLIQPFFQYYSSLLDLRVATTRAWFGHDGAYFRENLQLGGDEIDDSERPPGLHDKPPKTPLPNPRPQAHRAWHDYHFNSGLEISYMMLQYHRATADARFRDEVLLPMARECLLFFDHHYPRDPQGRLRLEPSQVLETFWIAINPSQDIAGLRALLDGLLSLDGITEADRASWTRFRAEIPPLPTHLVEGTTVLSPAESYGQLSNCENGELYSAFPYDLVGVAAGSVQLLRDTMPHRTSKNAIDGRCWTQDQIHFAYAGQAAEAQVGLEHRFRQHSTVMRFPFFAREFPDHVPDLDNNGSGSVALQRMLLQEAHGKIYLLPAWPRSWDADFKLHATGNTVIQGIVRNGSLESWSITPETRRADVILGSPQ